MKKLKKLTAMTLVMSLMTANFTNVYANKQGYVQSMTVTDSSPTSQASTNYKIKFGWDEPMSAEIDIQVGVQEGETLHSISTMYAADPSSAGYDMYFRNGTKNEAYSSTNQIFTENYNKTMSVDINKDLLDSSVYSFTAVPWHIHKYVTQSVVNGVTNTTTTYKRAPFENNGKNFEALYLTDIKLDAKAEGKEVTFSWKNPTYMNKTIFSGYNIYYDINGSNKNAYIQVKADDTNLKLSNGMYSYTTTLDKIDYGRFYDVKIEPLIMYNGSLVELRSAPTPEITIDNVTYPIGFSSRTYLYKNLYLTPSIKLDDISSGNIQISWDKGNYSRVEIYQSSNPGTDGSIEGYDLVGAVSGEINSSLTSFILQKPSTITYYKAVFYFGDGSSSMVSNWVVYDPSYKAFEPYLPKIYEFYGQEETATPQLYVTFNAFTREPINEEERLTLGLEVGQKFVDPNVDYTIWITDDAENFNSSSFDTKYVAKLKGTELTAMDYLVPEDSTDAEAGETVKVYKQNFSTYYTYSGGEYVQKPTKDGKIYYIKIEAVRSGGDTSKIATDLTYVKPLVDNISNPITLTNPPLRLEVDENGVPIKTIDSFNIEWQESWNEVYDYKTEQWYAVIGVDANNKIVYGKAATDALGDSSKVIPLYEGQYFTGDLAADTKAVVSRLKKLGVSDADLTNFVMRRSSLANANYDIFVTSYANMEANGGYEVYYNKFLKEEDVWRGISPTYKNGAYNYTVDAADDPAGALEPGTSYVVYIRPYVTDSDGNKIYSYNPGYVVGETLTERGEIPVTPPTIVLFPVDETQSSITFEFEYSDTFVYEFRISNKLQDYTDGGNVITNEDILAYGRKYTNEKGDVMMQYTYENLAPDTKYFTWGKATYGDISSAWSLPLEQRTDPLEKPVPPKALGLMDKNNVEIINDSNGTNYINPDETSFIIDFARIPDDENEHENEIVDNRDGQYMYDELIPRFPGAYFDELVPNQKYYIRAKTVLTVVVDGITAEYYYGYEVQISESSRFEEVDIVHVFESEEIPDGIGVFRIESDWSTTVVAKTGKTDSEYDGDKDDILYPIPDSNYEIVTEDDKISFIYRGSGKDSQGNNNNLTDQRLISDLVENGAYSLMADLSEFDTQTNKPIREVQIPYRLVTALNAAKIDFTFKAQNTYLTTSFQDIDKIAKANNIKDFGNDSMIIIQYTNKTSTYASKLGGGSFITPAERISMTIKTPTRSVPVLNTYDTVEIAFNIQDRLEYELNNVYVASFDDYGNKKVVPHTYDDEVGTININTKMLMTYGAVKEGMANTTAQPDYYYNVTSKLNITDLRPYNGSDAVYALYFNNIVAGILRDKPEIEMKGTLSQEDYTPLGRSGLLVSGDKVTREKGIVSLVKLYEIETGEPIVLEISTSSVPGISKVASANKTAIAKAYQIGLYDDSNTNFASTLTFDEFFYMLDLILTDSQ